MQNAIKEGSMEDACIIQGENVAAESRPDSKKARANKRKKKAATIFGYDIRYFFVGMIVFAFFGFCAENIGRMAVQHIFDCRHQILPFLFAYGIALLAVYVLMGTPDELRFFNIRIFKSMTRGRRVLSHLIYFAVIFFFIMVGEIAVGMIYEKFAGVILWDYSNIPTHITRYTSIITTLLYGGGVYLLMAFAFKPMMNLISKMGTKAATIIDCTLGVAIVLDFIATLIIMFATGEAPNYWSVKF